MTLLYLVAAWVAGIFLASSSTTTAGVWLLVAGGGLMLSNTVHHHRPWRILAFCAVLFALGAARHAWATRPLDGNHVANFTGAGHFTLTGTITQDADIRDNHVNLRVEVDTIRYGTGPDYDSDGLLLVQAPRYGEYQYGDCVRVSGELQTPPEFDDFSYREYLARRGIHAIMPYAEVDVIAQDQGRPWFALMFSLKERAQNTINDLLPSPQAPLLSGILLGNERDISEDVREDFNATGTSHVIAISGANIIIVIRVLMGLLRPATGQRRAAWFTVGGVAGYTLLVGADPAVVRAAIMGGLSLVAMDLGRRTYGLTSLAFSVWLMTLWNPLTLWDVGFQLSVAATAGLVLFNEPLTKLLDWLLRRGFSGDTARQITKWLSEPVVVSLAAQITTTPLILLYFERLSLVSFFANVLIVPAQPYIMTVGGLAVLLGMVWQPLGAPLAWIVWIPLSYTLGIVRRLGDVEWAATDVDLTTQHAWGFYGLLLVMALFLIQHRDDRAALLRVLRQRITALGIVIGGAVVAILVWASALSQPDGKLHVWFLDIGHGNAVLIQTPDGAQILVDGGPNPTQLRRAVGDHLPFRDRDLDVLIVTQPRDTAIGALPELLDQYDVGLVLTNGQTGDSEEFDALQRAWAEQKVEVVPVSAGYRVETNDGVLLEILHPQTAPESNTNTKTAAIVIRVSYGDTSFLLTSELSETGALTMLEAGRYAGSTVLQLPDHGSGSTNSRFFLQTIDPQVAVINVGAGNRAGLPDPAVIAHLSAIGDRPLYRTDQDGTVEMVTDGRTLWVYAED
ncbi:MAG: DUF4131 domain-containing protein [Chloroflexi bacterium]|nr:DUF4131 domain-containing protein [Chloroflexota bacterium]